MIYLASDHRGYNLKEKIKSWLSEWGHEYEDMGAFELNQEDDYPDFISKVAEKVSADSNNSKGIILGGSGQGEAIVANRYPNVRATVYYGPSFAKASEGKGLAEEIIKLSREHNDANTLSLGASFVDDEAAKKAIELWLGTEFSGDERHQRRIEKINKLKI